MRAWLIAAGIVAAGLGLVAVAWWHAARIIAMDEEAGHVGGLDEEDL